MAGVRVHVVMPRELVERIDAAVPEGVSRGGFIKAAVERALGESDAFLPPVDVSEPARIPVPERLYRAKRDVRPIPKGG